MAKLTKTLTVGNKAVSFYSTANEALAYGTYGNAIVDGVSAYYALGAGSSTATGSGVVTGLRVMKNNTSYYMLTQGFSKYTGNYKMSSLYPSTYATMTSVNMNTVGSNNPGLLTGMTTAEDMFRGCNKLTSISNIASLDTSHITNMIRMFGNVYSEPEMALTSLNLSTFDTRNVTNMFGMFCRQVKLTSITLGSNFDTSKVTDFQDMFKHVPITTISRLDTSSATNLVSMFESCEKLPATFPWAIDCKSVTRSGNLRAIFKLTPVTKLTLKNVSSSIRSEVTSSLIRDDNKMTITFQ